MCVCVCVYVCVCVCVSSTRAKMAEHACCNVLLMCCYDAIAWHITHTRAHTHTHARMHARTHARAHAHAHARTHIRARAHTHTRTHVSALSFSLALSLSLPLFPFMFLRSSVPPGIPLLLRADKTCSEHLKRLAENHGRGGGGGEKGAEASRRPPLRGH